MFATNENDPRNPFGLYKIYAKKRPPKFCDVKDLFYLATNTVMMLEPQESESDRKESMQWFIRQKMQNQSKVENTLSPARSNLRQRSTIASRNNTRTKRKYYPKHHCMFPTNRHSTASSTHCPAHLIPSSSRQRSTSRIVMYTITNSVSK
ncbi:hypothetical protein DPMN_095101 [Dreissena polymorpha]|uniref:Uncharacterized protein n=1 Tax=Dreissena polymorpha TaxID=45954 RepID=A0A9D4L7A1_DREPO|nr:hypothetical protein DPMN_095101 [Dreissena polymorpha]